LGKFELASGGTLFLDEIGEIPPDIQVKLLRVLQEKAVVRVGGDRTIPVNCRVIAATNQDLHQAVAEKRFRRDLLYRLDVITIEIPPLRERRGDIVAFVASFVGKFAERNSKVVEGIEPAVLDRLVRYAWPGNVRELENVVERAVALAKGRLLQLADLPVHLQESGGDGGAGEAVPLTDLDQARRGHQASERRLYIEALRAERGDIQRAARLLGISRATLYRRLREHDLKTEVSKSRLES
jgi:two-component system response regulator HydG